MTGDISIVIRISQPVSQWHTQSCKIMLSSSDSQAASGGYYSTDTTASCLSFATSGPEGTYKFPKNPLLFVTIGNSHNWHWHTQANAKLTELNGKTPTDLMHFEALDYATYTQQLSELRLLDFLIPYPASCLVYMHVQLPRKLGQEPVSLPYFVLSSGSNLVGTGAYLSLWKFAFVKCPWSPWSMTLQLLSE